MAPTTDKPKAGGSKPPGWDLSNPVQPMTSRANTAPGSGSKPPGWDLSNPVRPSYTGHKEAQGGAPKPPGWDLRNPVRSHVAQGRVEKPKKKPRVWDFTNPDLPSREATEDGKPNKVIGRDHITNTRGLSDVRARATPVQAAKTLARLFEAMPKSN